MQILFMLLKQQNQKKKKNYACFVAAVRHVVMWIFFLKNYQVLIKINIIVVTISTI